MVTNTAKITLVNDNKDEIKNSENNNNKSSNDSKGEMNKSDEQKILTKIRLMRIKHEIIFQQLLPLRLRFGNT